MSNSLDDDFNETETREFITDALKTKGWKLKLNMRYEFKITDGRVQIDEDDDSYRSEALFADYLLYAPNNQPLCVVEAKRVLEVLMQTYADQGILAFEENEALKAHELQDLGTPLFIKSLFGGKDQFKKVIRDIEEILYAA